MSRQLCFLIFCGAFSLPAAGQLVPVFEYRFPDSYAGGEDFGVVIDQSPAGNDGSMRGASGVAVELSTDVPPGAPPTARSLDFKGTPGSIVTDGTQLLSLPQIIENGGYTFEVWFKGIPSASAKIIDYAGTQYIGVRPADWDQDGKVGEIFVSAGNAILTELILDEDDGLNPNGWNHVKLIYTVTDASNPTSVVGHATVILNGHARTAFNKGLTDFGDSLNRPTAVGSHPALESASTGNLIELYDGLVYNPAAYLGTDHTEPMFGLVSGNEEGFAATIIDTSSPVKPDTVTVTFDGQPLPVDVSKSGNETHITYQPGTRLPGGVHRVTATYSTEAGGPYTSTAVFHSIGDAVEPVLEYRFPASYAATGEDTNVVDQSPAKHDGTLNIPVALSDDVPPTAPAGTASLDLTEGAASIVTKDIDLVTAHKVLAAGGFTFDIWFKGDATANLNKIIDIAGTDWLAVSTADSDGDGNVGEVVISIGNNYAASLRLDVDDGYLPGEWNHAVITYQVTNGANMDNLTGTLTFNLNGVVRSATGRAFTNYNDRLNRPIAIGSHPTSGGERFTGLVYQPKIYLGVVPAQSPSYTVYASAAQGLLIEMTDSAGAVEASTVQLSIDGVSVTPVVNKADGLTSVGYVPATPLAGGMHTALVTFSYEGGAGFDQALLPFYIRSQGGGLTPLFSYVFPTSYDGSIDRQDVYDESPAGTMAIADGYNGDAPIGLSTDIPPGAPSGTQSLDLTTDYGVILTNRLQLLNVPSIIAAGGFTIDLWFKGVPSGDSGFQKIFDYAGTESIAIDLPSQRLRVTLNSSAQTTLLLGEDEGLNLDDWNHVVVEFHVLDEWEQNRALGNLVVKLNDYETSAEFALTNYGDTLNRPTAIGRHPTAATEYYRGLIYSPSLYLGVASTPPTGNASINVSREGNSLIITFEGQLQSSPDLRTPFAPVPGATSPYTVPLPASGQMFYRAVP